MDQRSYAYSFGRGDLIMDNLANIKLNINSSMVKLKREWSTARETWKDSKAKEYEKTYLARIVVKQKSVANEIEALEKMSEKLKKLGVEI